MNSNIIKNLLENINGHISLWVAITACILIVLTSAIIYISKNRHQKSIHSPAPRKTNKDLSTTWNERLQAGMSRTRNALKANFDQVFSKNIAIDESLLEALHESLFRADIGVKTTDRLINYLKDVKREKGELSGQDAYQALKDKTAEILNIKATTELTNDEAPTVILIVGVNGVGKTTSIGKLTSHFQTEGKKVVLAAGDTFRAAAIDQLKVWGERLNTRVIAHKQGGDPSAVCFDAVKAAKNDHADALIIDTAGRLQSKENLMNELAKIKRVIGRDLPGAPHHIWLVIDATTGQNAFSQVKAFNDVCDLTGLIVTKLDGTAKGGVLIGISDQFKIPTRYIGIGEKVDDLRPYNAKDFSSSIFDTNS